MIPAIINFSQVVFLLLTSQPEKNLNRLSSHFTTMSTADVKGVWQREFEEDPLGDSENADRDTLVLWTQAPASGIYVDLRLPEHALGRRRADLNKDKNPAALQARGTTPSQELLSSNEQMDILLRQKSFAGILNYSIGDTTTGEALAKDTTLAKLSKEAADFPSKGALCTCTCYWERHIDYQPPTGGKDIGVCASSPPNADGSIDLRETGDDASYAEGWHRLPGSNKGPFLACKLISEDDIERSGYWVRTGNKFAYAVGRPKDLATATALGCLEGSAQLNDCVGKSLTEAVAYLDNGKEKDTTQRLQMLGSYVSVFGEVTDCGKWNIIYSTDPGLVGCQLVGEDASGVTCSTLQTKNGAGVQPIQEGDFFIQQLINGISRRWQLIEVDGVVGLPGLQ